MKTRQVAQQAEFINAHEFPPMQGSQLIGLTRGGKLIELTWQKDSINFVDATCAYPKIPASVKAIQQARWTPEEFKGEAE